MNIAMITLHYPPNIHGGGEISCKLLVENLRKKGHKVDVFILDKVFPNTKSKIHLNKQAYDYLKREVDGYDIVHAYNMSLLPSIGKLTKEREINSYATLNGIVFSPSLSTYQHRSLSPKFYRNKICFNQIKQIKLFSTLCEFWRKKWIVDGIPSTKISVITNMIDPEFKVKERNEHKGFNFLHIGNHSPTRAEEIEKVVKIFSSFKSQNIKLTMIGSGVEEKNRLIEKYRPKNEVEILDTVNNMYLPIYYANSDFFIHPSILPKGNDRVIIEAMQHGCVVLTHCTDDFSPIIEDRKSGFLIYPNIESSYVTRIKLLMKDKILMDKVSNNAKNQVKNVCNPEKITEKYLKNYGQIE